MFTPYKRSLITRLAGLYEKYASSATGLPKYSDEYWRSILEHPLINAERDIIISCDPEDAGEGSSVIAFSWFYTGSMPERVVLRGPYVELDNPDLDKLLENHIDESIARAEKMEPEFIEARALFPQWAKVYESRGFERAGTYERMRLFPLRGDLKVAPVPSGCEIREYRSVSDLNVLVGLFADVFSCHWDYSPPRIEDWKEIIKTPGFEPSLVHIAFSDGKPSGYAFGEPIIDPFIRSVDSAYLISIGVTERDREKGLGAAVLSKWLRGAYKAGFRAAELDVDEKNSGAKFMYEKFGFGFIRAEEIWRYHFR